jgi:WD40 repeat protein
MRDLLLRLVASSPDGEPVRSRVPRRIVATDPVHEQLVERLVAARLVTSGDGVVELAHEAVARAWPRLQGWLDEDSEGQRILRHLTGAADTWDAMGRPDSELYRGARLDRAVEWRDRTQPDLTPTEEVFLDAGQTLANTERQVAENHTRRQARQNRRLRGLFAATAVFLVGSIVVGGVAVTQRDRAEREGRVAMARQLAAAANANLDVDPERSVLLALAAIEHTRSANGSVLPEAEEALHSAVTASRIERHVEDVGGTLDWSPDGALFVTEGPEDAGVVDIRAVRTGDSVRSFVGHDGDINDVVFNHDGTMFATTGDDGAARLWDRATGELVHTVQGSTSGEVWGPSFSPDGSLFAASWYSEGIVRVLDIASGQIVREIRSVPGPAGSAFDPSGRHLAIPSYWDPMAVVIDVRSGDEVFTLEGHRNGLHEVAWSPDGMSIATASWDGSARVYDARTGSHRFALLSGGGTVYGLDWSPDSTRLVTAHSDGTARMWLVTEGGARELFTLSAQDTSNGITGVAFSPDGTRVMTGDIGATTTRIWDVSISGGAELANLPAATATHNAVAYTPDGRNLLATGATGSVNIWDADTFTTLGTLSAPTPSSPATAVGTDVLSIELSPDGRLAAARLDGSVQVWDVETARVAFALATSELVPDMDWHPDGDLLAITTRDNDSGRVTILDRDGREVTVLHEDPGVEVGSVAFSADGEQLITTRVPAVRPDPDIGQVVIWDWKEGEVERTIDTPVLDVVSSPTAHLVATTTQQQRGIARGGTVDIWNPVTGQHVAALAGQPGGVMAVAFSADGTLLVTGSSDGTVRIWDPHTGEQLRVLRGHYTSVTGVAFSPDGSRLASVGAEGIVRVWALDLDDLIEIAQRRLTRTLTDEECQQYLHVRRCP